MRVLVTGAGGFLGGRLVKALLAEPALTTDDGRREQIDEIIATSRSGVLPIANDGRVTVKAGDLGHPAFIDRLFDRRIDTIFHLAAAPEDEEDVAAGLKVNILAFIQLMERARTQAGRPRLVYASSFTAFAGSDRVCDRLAYSPQSSDGAAKAIGELLVNDYTRRGFIDGRSLRLPIVLARPERSRGAVTDQVSALMREPLAGRDLYTPLDPDHCVPVVSMRNAVRSLIRVHEIPADRFGETRAMNMPALTVRLAEIAEAAESAGLAGPKGRVFWEGNGRHQSVTDCWPSVIIAEVATRHGLAPDASAADIVRAYIEDCQPRADRGRPTLTLVEGVGEKAPSDL